MIAHHLQRTMIACVLQQLTALARLWPFAPDASEDLERSCRFLRSDTPDPESIVAAGYVVGALAFLVTAVSSAVLTRWVAIPLPPFALLSVAVAVGATTVHVVHSLPVWVATFRRTRALGSVTTLVGITALRLRLTPVPELAVRFAARTGTGGLADSLSRHAAAARGTPRSGLTAFASAWRPWFPALDRAASLLVAAADAPPDGRRRALDRAVDTVGDAVESRAASFAGRIRGPVTGLYALGVLLPLALVGAVPAATVAGVPITPVTFATVYDGLLPLGIVVAGARIVLSRPVAFPPPAIPRDHPDLPDRRTLALVAGLAVAACAWLLAGRVVADWASPVAAVGGGVGTALVVGLRPAMELRKQVRELERGLPDALALVGRRVADGQAVEVAIDGVGETLPDPVGGAFTAAARRQRTLRVGVERAFLGDHGPFVRTPTTRGRGITTLLAVAASEGQPAGTILLDEAERLDTLRDHERRARREIAAVTDTLSNTAAVFGPLVGGATVALAGRLDGLDASAVASVSASAAGAALSPATLGTAVGIYVLLLAVLLPTLATALQHGVDRVLVGYRVGSTLLAATATFLVGVSVTGLIV
jgi:Flp pilus assembly protein TadB